MPEKYVKLQMLMKRPMHAEELATIERALADLGAAVTARGTVTLSATMPQQRFEEVFAKPFAGRSGFASSEGIGTTRSVPPALGDYIETISETPRHMRMSQ
jgi:hypothetical protein